jgi:hypothetical protein
MSGTEAIFLALVFVGVLALLAGLILTRLHWRLDIPSYGRGTRFLDVTLHPERYAKDAPFGVIRSVSAIGAALLACAIAVVAWRILQTMLKS